MSFGVSSTHAHLFSREVSGEILFVFMARCGALRRPLLLETPFPGREAVRVADRVPCGRVDPFHRGGFGAGRCSVCACTPWCLRVSQFDLRANVENYCRGAMHFGTLVPLPRDVVGQVWVLCARLPSSSSQ